MGPIPCLVNSLGRWSHHWSVHNKKRHVYLATIYTRAINTSTIESEPRGWIVKKTNKLVDTIKNWSQVPHHTPGTITIWWWLMCCLTPKTRVGQVGCNITNYDLLPNNARAKKRTLNSKLDNKHIRHKDENWLNHFCAKVLRHKSHTIFVTRKKCA